MPPSRAGSGAIGRSADSVYSIGAAMSWAGLGAAFAAFAASVLLPLGFAVSGAYVLAVLATGLDRRPYVTLAMALLASAFACASLALPGRMAEPVWLSVAQLAPTLAAIWAAAALARLVFRMARPRPEGAAEAARFAQMLTSIGDGIIATDAEGRIDYINPGAERITGWSVEEAAGRPLEEIFDLRAEVTGERLENPFRQALAGKKTVILEEPKLLHRRDGASLPVEDSAAPILDEFGNLAGAVLVFRSIAERRRSEEQMQLKLGEATHRIRNVFANVRAILSLCERSAQTPGELARCVEERLASLMRSYDRLAHATQQGASLRQILIEELEPYMDMQQGRLHYTGHDVLLESAHTVSVGMIIHELATNAAKYGSLSNQHGRLLISSDFDEGESILTLHWYEVDGPEAKPSERRGLGSQLIEGLVRSQFSGSWSAEYPPEGLRASLALKLPNARPNAGES